MVVTSVKQDHEMKVVEAFCKERPFQDAVWRGIKNMDVGDGASHERSFF